jgi:hypothetical protein
VLHQGTLTSDGDADRYVAIRNLLRSIFNTRWESKLPYWSYLWTHFFFYFHEVKYSRYDAPPEICYTKCQSSQNPLTFYGSVIQKRVECHLFRAPQTANANNKTRGRGDEQSHLAAWVLRSWRMEIRDKWEGDANSSVSHIGATKLQSVPRTEQWGSALRLRAVAITVCPSKIRDGENTKKSHQQRKGRIRGKSRGLLIKIWLFNSVTLSFIHLFLRTGSIVELGDAVYAIFSSLVQRFPQWGPRPHKEPWNYLPGTAEDAMMDGSTHLWYNTTDGNIIQLHSLFIYVLSSTSVANQSVRIQTRQHREEKNRSATVIYI